jgi:flavin reductase (DIM6/NTAB) family NADH-FMN oxidoreductase RutF
MTASHRGPPDKLDRPLEVGPSDWTQREFYLLISALVVPRPIGWISTISASGVSNLAPYSFFNLLGSDPPYAGFGSTGAKDSVTNLRDVPEFVVNIVSVPLLEKMNLTATDFPSKEDEFRWAALTAEPSAMVRPHRVAEAKAHLECELVHVISERNTHIALGRVIHAHVDQSVWRSGRVDPRLLDPVGRLAGSAYATLGELLNLPRVPWGDLKPAPERSETFSTWCFEMSSDGSQV